MASRLYYVQEVTCDQCRRIARMKDDTGDVEGKIPQGWVELTARSHTGEKGNENLFADLCPKCYKKLPFQFHSPQDALT